MLFKIALIDKFGEMIAKKCGMAWSPILSLAITVALNKMLSGINPEDVQAVAEKMQEFAKSAIDAVAAVSAEGVHVIRRAINTFFKENDVKM